MAIARICFRGVEPMPQSLSQKKFPSAPVQTDEEKSNASKYMIGATALASVVALGVAGYKGKLGKGVQKFLGGAKKATEKSVSGAGSLANDVTKGTSGTSGLADDVVKGTHVAAGRACGEIEKYTAEELEKLGSKKLSEVTPEELKKVIDTIIPEDEPVLKIGIEKIYEKRIGKQNPDSIFTVKDLVHNFSVMRRALRMRICEEGLKNILGTNSPLNKKLNELKFGDVLDAIPEKLLQQIPQEQQGFINMFDRNITFQDFIKRIGVQVPKELDLNKSFIEQLNKFEDVPLSVKLENGLV